MGLAGRGRFQWAKMGFGGESRKYRRLWAEGVWAPFSNTAGAWCAWNKGCRRRLELEKGPLEK